MALLYWQLGREVGAVKRLLEEESINWGYFIDHNPFEPHCNAHPNNFVVLPSVRADSLAETNCISSLSLSLHTHTHTHTHAHTHTHIHTHTQGGAKLLAPVDFDLAYLRKGFFSPYTGSYDDELFASWQGSEHTELERALGGERVNTGVSMTELGVRALGRERVNTGVSMTELGVRALGGERVNTGVSMVGLGVRALGGERVNTGVSMVGLGVRVLGGERVNTGVSMVGLEIKLFFPPIT